MITGFATTQSAFDQLVIGNTDLIAYLGVMLASGQVLKRGALLGRITATDYYVLSVAAAVDGSQAPRAILVDDCDASSGDKAVLAYTRGDFDADALIYGAGHTADSVRDGLRQLGINLQKRF